MYEKLCEELEENLKTFFMEYIESNEDADGILENDIFNSDLTDIIDTAISNFKEGLGETIEELEIIINNYKKSQTETETEYYKDDIRVDLNDYE